MRRTLMEVKTNVMRILEKQKLGYKHYCYVETGATNGEEVAALLGEDPLRVFKTLVTVAKSDVIMCLWCRSAVSWI